MSLRRGRQYYRSYPCFRLGISIHASTRGTTAFVASCFPTAKFQSTSPRGGRPIQSHVTHGNITISIHVPTRGTTSSGGRRDGREGNFNPRPHAGDDVLLMPKFWHKKNFNPRPHAGDDTAKAAPAAIHHHISIHVPTRGTTGRGSSAAPRCTHFNPRPHAGDDTPTSLSSWWSEKISIHVPTRGTTIHIDTLHL